ncbi:MAG: GNAT family N-acetyltransferase, partial [Candidatus Micrarchaeia archaeon]
MTRILFLAEGNKTIGLGHLSRCFTLAREMHDSKVCFQTRDPAAAEIIRRRGYECETVRDYSGARADLIVTDLRYPEKNIFRKLRQNCRVLAAIDDYAPRVPFDVDYLNNGHAYACSLKYDAPTAVKLFGFGYSFHKITPPNKRVHPPSATRVLVSMGGADPAKLTEKALRALAKIPNLEVTVTVGALCPREKQIRALARQLPGACVIRNAKSVPELMLSSHVALCTAGMTLEEAVATATPALAIASNKDETLNGAALAKLGCCTFLGTANRVTPAKIEAACRRLSADKKERERLSSNCAGKIDGKGPERVARILLDATAVELKQCAPEDAWTVLCLRNQPDARSNSRDSHIITLKEHAAWFERALDDPNTRQYLVRSRNKTVGVARLKIAEKKAEVSITVDKRERGKGYATRALRLLEREAGYLNVGALVAEVKKSNAASNALFSNAGYSRASGEKGWNNYMKRVAARPERIAGIVQARMGSTRLLGKMLERVQGKSVLERVVTRLKRCLTLDAVIVATTGNKEDDVLAREAKRLGVRCFRGSENDVLDRFHVAAKGFDAAVRITGDCPLIDPVLVDNVACALLRSNADYASNVLERAYVRGFDAEAFTSAALERAWLEARGADEREHVTPYFYS